MNELKFKVGDLVCCRCGYPQCVPFTITEFAADIIKGIDVNGEPVWYYDEDLENITPVTKLEKALK